MEVISLNMTDGTEESLIKVGTHKFILKNQAIGQYGFGKLMVLKVVKADLSTEIIARIGYTKEEIDFDRYDLENCIKKNSSIRGCLVDRLITYSEGLELAKDYINKII